MEIAITHAVSSRMNECELTYMEPEPIDIKAAAREHDAYCETLMSCGLQVVRLEDNLDYPDCAFVEDNAVVVDELAVIPHMGAASRRAEVESISAFLERHRELAFLEPPATLEGGDVMRIGKEVFVGLSTRTNAAGVSALRNLLAPFGYTVTPVEVHGCLHLKTGVTPLNDQTLIANTKWIDLAPLSNFEIIPAHASEPWACNVLRAGEKVVMHAGHEHAIEEADKRGISVAATPISEFMKAEAGLTCMSVIFSTS